MDAGRIEDTDNVQQPTEQMAVVDVVDIEYPTGLKLATVLAAVGLSLILVGLDFNIIATAVPSITTHFNTISDVGWYYSAYRLTACSFQFMFGKMYYLFSVKTVFLVSVVIFEIGSLISAVAPMSSLLILGRAVSGLGCAGIISGVFTIATQSVPLRQRPFFSGLAAGIEGISSTAAPLLGGVLTDSLSWRWCFYINLPLGVITFILVLLFFQDPQPAGHSQRQSLSWKQKAQKLDLLGTAIFLSSITCLLLAIQWGGLTYTWGNARIIVLLCLAVALLAAFVWQERRKGDDALLPGRIMKHRSLLAGMWFSFCNNAALSVVDYYMPTYLQVVRGVSATESGVLCLPIVVGLSLAIFLAGSATSLLGYYVPFMLGTSVLTPIASGLITTLKVHEPLATLICYQGFFGISGGIGFQGPQVAAQTILSTKDSPIGIAVIIFAQNFGPAVFVSVAQTIFTQQLQDYLGSLLPGMDASKLEDLGLSDLKKYIPSSELADVIELYDKALDTTFYLTVGLACASLAGTLAMEWRSIKQKSS